MTKKYTITRSDIRHIKDLGVDVFKRRRWFGDLDDKETQILLIIESIRSYLISKGVEVDFDVDFDPYKRYIEENS